MEKVFLNLVVQCPKCKSKFTIEDVLSDKVRSEFDQILKSQIDSEIERYKEEELRFFQMKMQKEYEEKLSTYQKALEEYRAKSQNQELKYQLELQKLQNQHKLDLQKLMAQQQNTVEIFEKQLAEMRAELQKRNEELEQARKVEIELRRKENELALKEQNLELEIQRRLSVERNQLQELIRKNVENEYILKAQEKDMMIASLQKQIEELNLKIQTGSQQRQGEAQEIVLEEQLRTKFPLDGIEPVPKGIRGADIIQEVRNKFGERCGLILWESKRTSSWCNEWITKLKADQRELGAEFSAIVSRVLPKEINSIGLLDGVWVCDFDSFIGLAMALRENLIQIQALKNSLMGKETKMEQIYNYICSEQFAQKVKAIVESFVSMKADLEKEKIAMEKHWKKREEELNKIIKNTSRIYGELEALVGNQLPEISYFQLPGK